MFPLAVHLHQAPPQAIEQELPKMNQISSWAIPFGKVNITFTEDPNRPENKVLFKVLCSDGIVYVVQTKPFKENTIEVSQ